MKFLSKFSLAYSAIALVLTILYYYISNMGGQTMALILFIIYLAMLLASALVLSIKEGENRFAGFNYHALTYIICMLVPLSAIALGIFPRSAIKDIVFVMLTWGVGLAFHFAMYWFIFRKKMIRNYEKEEIFK